MGPGEQGNNLWFLRWAECCERREESVRHREEELHPDLSGDNVGLSYEILTGIIYLKLNRDKFINDLE